jgi:hypothetical protein
MDTKVTHRMMENNRIEADHQSIVNNSKMSLHKNLEIKVDNKMTILNFLNLLLKIIFDKNKDKGQVKRTFFKSIMNNLETINKNQQKILNFRRK